MKRSFDFRISQISENFFLKVYNSKKYLKSTIISVKLLLERNIWNGAPLREVLPPDTSYCNKYNLILLTFFYYQRQFYSFIFLSYLNIHENTQNTSCRERIINQWEYQMSQVPGSDTAHSFDSNFQFDTDARTVPKLLPLWATHPLQPPPQSSDSQYETFAYTTGKCAITGNKTMSGKIPRRLRRQGPQVTKCRVLSSTAHLRL